MTAQTAGSPLEVRASARDWIMLIIGAYLALAPIWTATAPVGWFVPLGIAAVGLALWGLFTTANQGFGWTLVALGVLTFVAPWIGSFAGTAAGWTAWVAGALAAVVASVELTRASQTAA